MFMRRAPAFAAMFVLTLTAALAQSGTVTIGGTVKGAGNKGVAAITVQAEGQASTVTDSKGRFALEVPSGWSGRVFPSGAGIDFTPAQRAYSNLTRSLKSQNFSGKTGLAGCVANSLGQGVSGIAISLNHSGGSGVTGAEGCYLIQAPLSWSGTITPSAGKATFSPRNRSAGPLRAPLAGQDFLAEDLVLTGSLLDTKKKAVQGTRLLRSADSGSSAPVAILPDARGNFSGPVPFGWSGRLVPRPHDFAFSPPEREYRNLRAGATKQKFTATPAGGPGSLTLKIVDLEEQPVAGALVVLHSGDGAIEAERTTSADGLAVFQNINRPAATFTVAREVVYSDGIRARSIESLADIPLSSATLVFAVASPTAELPASPPLITVDIPGKTEGYLEPLAAPWFFTDPLFPIYPWQVQSDGKLTLLGLDGDPGGGTGDWSAFGFLTDQPADDGSAFSIPLDRTGRLIPWSADRDLESVFVQGFRKGRRFILGSRTFGSFVRFSSGTVRAAETFPAEIRVVNGYTSRWLAEDQLEEWSRDAAFSTLPSTLTLDLPGVQVDQFLATPSPPSASWTLSGNQARDLANLTFEYLKPAADPEGKTITLRRSVILDGAGGEEWSFHDLALPETLSEWLEEATLDNACLMILDRQAALDFDEVVNSSLSRPLPDSLYEGAYTWRWTFFGDANRRHGPLLLETPPSPRPRGKPAPWLMPPPARR